MSDCMKCKYLNRECYQEPCNRCKSNVSMSIDRFEPMTNADRIRNMTDEELAEFMFSEIRTDRECMIGGNCTKDCGCADCFLEWLQSEAKESEVE